MTLAQRSKALVISSFVSTAGARRDPACVCRLAPPSWLRYPLGLVACVAYVFQWGYDGKQPSIVSLEDDGSSACVLSLACTDEVMREADANETSGELESAFPGSLVGEPVFRTAKLEMMIESAS